VADNTGLNRDTGGTKKHTTTANYERWLQQDHQVVMRNNNSAAATTTMCEVPTATTTREVVEMVGKNDSV
jgi:hypothetical protein